MKKVLFIILGLFIVVSIFSAVYYFPWSANAKKHDQAFNQLKLSYHSSHNRIINGKPTVSEINQFLKQMNNIANELKYLRNEFDQVQTSKTFIRKFNTHPSVQQNDYITLSNLIDSDLHELPDVLLDSYKSERSKFGSDLISPNVNSLESVRTLLRDHMSVSRMVKTMNLQFKPIVKKSGSNTLMQIEKELKDGFKSNKNLANAISIIIDRQKKRGSSLKKD